MSLTSGAGPFGRWPPGEWNVEMPEPERVMWLETSPRRVRVRRDGETIADSRRAKLLHEYRSLPVYYLPEEDVRIDALHAAGEGDGSPRRGRELRFDVAGARRAAWTHPDGMLQGLVGFEWGQFEWLEEDEVLRVHPRDPYHRVDILHTSRHVRVSVGGTVMADTVRARALFETGLPPRWYIPRDDVRLDLLEPSHTHTQCPYKGTASYFSTDDEPDIAWTYVEPGHEAADIAGYVCFWNERSDIDLDGERQERPVTQWSQA